jgi:hypothetical protein
MDYFNNLRISDERKFSFPLSSFNKEKYLEEAKMILSDLALNKDVVEAVINAFYFTEMYFNKNDLPFILKNNDTRWYYNEINYFMLFNIQEFDNEKTMRYSEGIPDEIIFPDYIYKKFDIMNYSKGFIGQ